MEIKFKSFSSGSCGNCYFLGIEDEAVIKAGILIDSGVSPRRVKLELGKDNLTPDIFSDILITHDHWDHICSIGSYCKRMPRPVWATARLHNAMAHNPRTSEYLPNQRRILSEEWTELAGGLFRVHPFIVPHDATQTAGYAIVAAGHKFLIMTDVGRVTDEALELASKADTVVIESNYDPEMLANGPYPPDLQQRIRGGNGHISNPECADAIRKFAHDGLKSIFLCHLSESNNTPALALQTARESAPDNVRVVALPRQTASPMFTL